MYLLAVIEHATRRIRILGATTPPTAVGGPGRPHLVMDLHDAASSTRYLIRDLDGKHPAMFDTILADSDITIVRSGVHVPE